MAKLIASPVSFSCKGFFFGVHLSFIPCQKVSKMDRPNFLQVKLFKNFQKTYEELVKSVLQFQNLTKGRGELYKNGKSQVSIERAYLFSYIKS